MERPSWRQGGLSHFSRLALPNDHCAATRRGQSVRERGKPMRNFGAGVIAAVIVGLAAPAAADDMGRWQAQAARVTIVRDDWGIAHVHGKTDADAVFGMVYAQAEDDFNRVETNYITALGRTAEAEGEAEIWRDLRMKLFITPAAMQEQYQASPA